MSRSLKFVFILVPLVILLVAGGIAVWGVAKKERVVTARYQAVFLTNGQVYFGKVNNRRAPYVLLTDIYYLQTREALQEGGNAKAKTPTEPELTLVKLGEELHGPLDRMEINRDHILFIEDLNEKGRVVQAIEQYTKKDK